MDFVVKNALNREQSNSPENTTQENNLSVANQPDLSEDMKISKEVKQAKIIVIGSGGAGNNSVTRLMEMGGAKGANTVSINTDMQHLEVSKADSKLLIGYSLTQGLGAGGYPEVGRQSAESSKKELRDLLRGAHLVFLTCGLGGGTGTGSLPYVAELAKAEGAIVVATVTTPFEMEKARIGKAEEGLIELRQYSDTVIVIDNDRLVSYVPDLPLNQAFAVADELIAMMIKGISETITVPSLVNLDFADIKAIMSDGGVAMIGVGESDSTNKVEEAVRSAMNHPLLDVDYKGATGALIHVTGGPSMTLAEVTEVGDIISSSLDPSAQVIWGSRVDPTMEGKVRVMSIVTGVKSPHILGRNGLPRYNLMATSKEQPKMLKELRIDYVS